MTSSGPKTADAKPKKNLNKPEEEQATNNISKKPLLPDTQTCEKKEDLSVPLKENQVHVIENPLSEVDSLAEAEQEYHFLQGDQRQSSLIKKTEAQQVSDSLQNCSLTESSQAEVVEPLSVQETSSAPIVKSETVEKECSSSPSEPTEGPRSPENSAESERVEPEENTSICSESQKLVVDQCSEEKVLDLNKSAEFTSDDSKVTVEEDLNCDLQKSEIKEACLENTDNSLESSPSKSEDKEHLVEENRNLSDQTFEVQEVFSEETVNSSELPVFKSEEGKLTTEEDKNLSCQKSDIQELCSENKALTSEEAFGSATESLQASEAQAVTSEEKDSSTERRTTLLVENSETSEVSNTAMSAATVEPATAEPIAVIDATEKDTAVLELKDSNPTDLVVSDEEDETNCPTATPTNTPVAGDSGQTSPVPQSSSDSLDDDAPAKDTSKPEKTEQVPSTSEKTTKSKDKEAKKDEKKKSKKKEDKGIEYILRALNSLQSPEEKLAALCKKYADLHEEHRVLQTSFKTQQRTMAVVMREKEQLQSEHTKAMMAKSKLESLCRELQKHNKIIKDESLKRVREEDERRKQISAQFQNTITEIQTQMTDNTERNTKLRQENADLAAQLQNIIKQCEARENQIDKVRKQHDLEQQLAAAKLAKAELQLKEEQERNGREKDLLIGKFTEQAKKNSMLEAQVEMFKERYDDFEKLHSRSSETFQKYKTEMDKMTKRIKKLEKEGVQWRTKWESSNKALIEQMEARNKSEKETITYVQKCKKLESLCRALQAELHGKKPAEQNETDQSSKDEIPTASSVPPNSPDGSSSDQCSPDSTNPPPIPSSSAPPSSQLSDSTTMGKSEPAEPSSPAEVTSTVCSDTEGKVNGQVSPGDAAAAVSQEESGSDVVSGSPDESAASAVTATEQEAA